MQEQHLKYLFVINPIAGGHGKEELHEHFSQVCDDKGFVFCAFNTTGDDDAAKLEEEIKREQPDVVVAVGGDGTVHLVGNLLVKNFNIPMGIIPFGSGNGMAKGLQIPLDFDDAIENLFTAGIKAIDTLKINNFISIHLSGLGFNAKVIESFSNKQRRGPESYAMSVLQEFLPYTPKSYHIISPHEEFKGEAFMVEITNSKLFGSSAVINPEGKEDDGYFEIVIIKPFPALATLKLLVQLYNEKIQENPHSHIISCREALIFNPELDVAHIDGEPVKLGGEINIKILPKSLKVIAP